MCVMLPGRAQEAAALSISPSALSLLLWSGAGWGRAEGCAGCSVSFWLEDSTGEGCVLLPLALVVAVLWGEESCGDAQLHAWGAGRPGRVQPKSGRPKLRRGKFCLDP